MDFARCLVRPREWFICVSVPWRHVHSSSGRELFVELLLCEDTGMHSRSRLEGNDVLPVSPGQQPCGRSLQIIHYTSRLRNIGANSEMFPCHRCFRQVSTWKLSLRTGTAKTPRKYFAKHSIAPKHAPRGIAITHTRGIAITHTFSGVDMCRSTVVVRLK